HRFGGAPFHLQLVIVARFLRLLRGQLRVLQLVTGLLQIDLGLLELADVGGGDIVAVHLDRRFDLRIKIDDLDFEPIFTLSQKFFGSHHLGDRIIKIGDAIAHVADRLLEDQLRVLRFFHNPAKQCAHRALESSPYSHFSVILRRIQIRRSGSERGTAVRKYESAARAVAFTTDFGGSISENRMRSVPGAVATGFRLFWHDPDTNDYPVATAPGTDLVQAHRYRDGSAFRSNQYRP